MGSDGKATSRLHIAPEDSAADYRFVPGLNGLRAVSIMAVLCGHFLAPEKYRGFAALGVFLFFAISGFLITRLLFAELGKTGRIDIGGFFYRRYLRLYPVLLFYLALFSLLYSLLGLPFSILDILSVIFYFTNYLANWETLYGGTMDLPIGALWSLAVEEHFYLIMPFAFVLMRGLPNRVARFAWVFIVVPLVIRYVYMTLWPHLIGTEFVYRPSETRFDSIAVGVLLAAICQRPDAARWLRPMASRGGLVFGVLLIAGTFAYKGELFGDTLRYTIRNFGCLFILCGIVFGPNLALLQRLANWSVADWIGRISYSLYIWQGSAWFFLDRIGLVKHSLAYGISGIALSFVLATFSYYCIERPALRLKHLVGRKTGSATALTGAG